MSTEGAGGISGGWYPEHKRGKWRGFPFAYGKERDPDRAGGYFPT